MGLATGQRRKDARAICRLSLRPLDPVEEEKWYRDGEASDPEGMAMYLKALAESKDPGGRHVPRRPGRGDHLFAFPAGKRAPPYSARGFGQIDGQ